LPPGDWQKVVTCEHAGNRVPPSYQYLFEGKKDLLQSHQGYDIGALSVAHQLAKKIDAAFFSSLYTRLLIDLNRSLSSRSLFSDITSILDKKEKERIIRRYYDPFRKSVCQHVTRSIQDGGFVLHFSVHTFTPVFKGVVRQVDVGVLYDPGHQLEKQIGRFLVKILRHRMPEWRIRCNYPYRGNADGLATYLRKKLPEDRYVGIELEINQKYPLSASLAWKNSRRCIVEHIETALNTCMSFRRNS